MNSEFHYSDGLKLRILFAIILFLSITAADNLITEESEKNALVQAIAYTGRSDFITSAFGFHEQLTFLKPLENYFKKLPPILQHWIAAGVLPRRFTNASQENLLTGIIGAYPSNPPNSTTSPTSFPIAGMTRTAVVF